MSNTDTISLHFGIVIDLNVKDISKHKRFDEKIDPDGVQDRRSRRLTRRNYVSPGPNFCWHVNGKQYISE